MPRSRKRKRSAVPIGHFFKDEAGIIFFKVGPLHQAWICDTREAGAGVVRLEVQSVIDNEVEELSLTEVSEILKKSHE